jgi:hypothetical protein
LRAGRSRPPIRAALSLPSPSVATLRGEERTEGLAREDLEADEKRANLRIEGRRNRIATVIDRITDAPCDDEDEALRIFTEVTERLDGDKFDLGFLEDPIDDQIARLCKEFGLPLPERPVARLAVRDPSFPPRSGEGQIAERSG